MNLFIALLITTITEFLIFFIFIKNDPLKLFFYSMIINSLTLPLATYGYLNIIKNIYMVELIVILAESFVIMFLLEVPYKKALYISISANIITTVVGFLL